MSDNVDYRIQHKREYHRKWRAEHPEAVQAAQMRYWAKKAAELVAAQGKQIEIRERVVI